jgi:hypothetical protein
MFIVVYNGDQAICQSPFFVHVTPFMDNQLDSTPMCVHFLMQF